MPKSTDISTSTRPAHLAKGNRKSLMDSMGGGSAEPFANISMKGSRFRFREGSEELSKANGDTIEVIIVGAVSDYQRVYYPPYVQGEASAPICQSADGKTPLSSSQEVQSAGCQMCPRNQKTKKLDNGQMVRECAYFKRLAVILPSAPDRVWQIDLKGQSLFGPGKKELNLYNWRDYIARMNSAGDDTEPYDLVTELTFDDRASVPKVMLKATRWTTAEEYAAAVEAMSSEECERIVNMDKADTVAPQGESQAQVEAEESSDEPLTQPKPKRTRAKAKAKVEPVAEEAQGELVDSSQFDDDELASLMDEI